MYTTLTLTKWGSCSLEIKSIIQFLLFIPSGGETLSANWGSQAKPHAHYPHFLPCCAVWGLQKDNTNLYSPLFLCDFSYYYAMPRCCGLSPDFFSSCGRVFLCGYLFWGMILLGKECWLLTIPPSCSVSAEEPRLWIIFLIPQQQEV